MNRVLMLSLALTLVCIGIIGRGEASASPEACAIWHKHGQVPASLRLAPAGFAASCTGAVVAQEIPPGQAQDEPGGEPGCSSAGSAGMEEQGEPAFLKLVAQARKHGLQSKQYAGALLGLGMFYNRRERWGDAQRVLTQSLAIIDGGALKPSPKTPPRPPLVEHHANGTVSATNMNPPKPYEEFMQDLLPALVQAEIETRNYASAEKHIKRMIALVPSDEVAGSLNLMSAYSSYATLLKRMGRLAEAKVYEKKADDINKSFKPL